MVPSTARPRLHREQARYQPSFYLDPPYWDCEDDYGANIFSKGDFVQLATQLGDIRGKFIMSLNDTLGVRETFNAFRIDAVTTTYSINSKCSKRVGEVLISNFPQA